MFTGIIETTGKIIMLDGAFLTVYAPSVASRLRRGGSIAMDGVCLTALSEGGQQIKVEVIPETLERTTLGNRSFGDFLNLELAISANGRFDGHFVTGHIDGMAEVKQIESYHNSHILTFKVSSALDRYIVNKGSITLNGISLTVISAEGGIFSVGIIPHTWKLSNLHTLRIGDKVNVEVDMIGKYVEKMLTISSNLST